jgi:hypothetical protein
VQAAIADVFAAFRAGGSEFGVVGDPGAHSLMLIPR